MIHRYIHNILTSGIQAIQDDLSILDELFLQNYSLDEVELNSIKTYFRNNGMEVTNGYARRDATFPLATIILTSDNEDTYFLNEEGAPIQDEDSMFFHMDLKSTIWAYNYQIMVMTEHPDITAYYYEIVKSIMLLGLATLVDLGCYGFQLSGGEMAPDPRYMPEHLFVRQLSFKCNMEFQRFDRDSKLRKAFQVSGMYLDRNSSNYDIGNVSDKVGTFTDGGETNNG